MTITQSDLEQTVSGRQNAGLPVVEGWKDGALTVFVPGTPKNPLNGSRGHWSKHVRWAKDWRERAANSIFLSARDPGGVRMRPASGAAFVKGGGWQWPWTPGQAKAIGFTVYGASPFDEDNLQAVVKPVRDALTDMRLIDDDRPSAGHVFVYRQVTSRKAGAIYGIAIRIALATP